MKLLPENAKIKNGKILVNGEEIAGYGERRMRELRGKLFSMVFQNPMTSLNPTMTVGAQIAEAVRAHQKDMGKEEVEQRVTELMQLVGIEQAEERKKGISVSLFRRNAAADRTGDCAGGQSGNSVC